MKLFFTGLMLISSMATAAGALRAGDLSVYPAKATLGQVGSRFSPSCPPEAQCEAQAFATVIVHLPGCLDRAGQTSSNVTIAEGNKFYVNVAATGIANKASRSARCMVENTTTIEVALPGFMMSPDEIILNDLNARN